MHITNTEYKKATNALISVDAGPLLKSLANWN